MKWTKEKCQEESLKYNYRNEFRIKSASSYRASIKNKWIDEITSHMLKPYEKNLIWTKEKCQEESLKYNYKHDFKKGNGSAYNSAFSNNWLNEICSHMIEICKPRNYWTKEKCEEEALKYNHRIEFKLSSSVCYSKSIELGCLSAITSHMYSRIKQNTLTMELCKKEALKYKTRTEFNKMSPSFYRMALKSDWLNDICSHMIVSGNKFKRCIYVYEFSDNCAYIGLTYNLQNRHHRHMNVHKNSAVFKHMKKTNITPKLIQLTNYISVNDASILEGKYIEDYKRNNWKILNKMKSGGTGGNIIKWNKEKCQEEALKYNSRFDFVKNNSSAYYSSIKNKWLDDVCSHMIQKQKPYRYWTKEKCQEEALKYDKITKFSKIGGAYHSAKKNKWLDEICSHMKYRK